MLFFLFCAINEFDVLWKRRRTAEVDTIIAVYIYTQKFGVSKVINKINTFI